MCTLSLEHTLTHISLYSFAVVELLHVADPLFTTAVQRIYVTNVDETSEIINSFSVNPAIFLNCTGIWVVHPIHFFFVKMTLWSRFVTVTTIALSVM